MPRMKRLVKSGKGFKSIPYFTKSKKTVQNNLKLLQKAMKKHIKNFGGKPTVYELRKIKGGYTIYSYVKKKKGKRK